MDIHCFLTPNLPKGIVSARPTARYWGWTVIVNIAGTHVEFEWQPDTGWRRRTIEFGLDRVTPVTDADLLVMLEVARINGTERLRGLLTAGHALTTKHLNMTDLLPGAQILDRGRDVYPDFDAAVERAAREWTAYAWQQKGLAGV